MREPTVKSIYKDSIRNITFEVLFYTTLEKRQVHQILDEYYRRYKAPFPKNGSTVKVTCDNLGPRSPFTEPG